MRAGTLLTAREVSDCLRVEGVVKNFGAISVLKGVDMHVEAGGRWLGLIGDNGAGKR